MTFTAQQARRPDTQPPPVASGERLSDFDYELPEELIAQSRRPRSEASRLMVLDRKTGRIECCSMRDLPALLAPGDVLVRNDTRVLPARLSAVRHRAGRGGGPDRRLEVEILLCHPLGGGLWEALARPAKRLKPGDILELAGTTRAAVEPGGADGTRRIRFAADSEAYECMTRAGTMPLPPYVHTTVLDPEEYQTCYAASPGAVAAPTAGFHFDRADFDRMSARGVELVDVTLHVGPGTFLPIRTEELSAHVMHRERFEVGAAAFGRIEQARAAGRRIVALGTTSVRVLESLVEEAGGGDGQAGWTDLFIRPGHRFKNVGALITNFHLPRTSLLVLVSAFAGRELVQQAYRKAIEQRFRFYSFGDGMIVL
ncbi:MAG: tRNA preQ1(34) S-adenosylmethionine ribosyltransferase-isomerase QueA [Candidatus Wallbacteria bacterium]|nr:tRNA preQ1(34) S-adenosylmethionine ribosyltransferase-isomerase QueA [Candidatus Wallbacteria bacterium]